MCSLVRQDSYSLARSEGRKVQQVRCSGLCLACLPRLHRDNETMLLVQLKQLFLEGIEVERDDTVVDRDNLDVLACEVHDILQTLDVLKLLEV
ncbi:hypothetical protein D3C80_1240650 [compost metagenome]